MTWEDEIQKHIDLRDKIFRDRYNMYQEAFELWNEKQIDMITEETGELIEQLGILLKFVAKQKRKHGNDLNAKRFSVALRSQQPLLTNIRNEIADVLIMLDQFANGMIYQTYEVEIKHKLQRLRNRLDGLTPKSKQTT